MKSLELKIKKLLLKKPVKNEADLASFKRKLAKERGIRCLSNVELLKTYHKLLKSKRIKKSETLENLLIKRKIRSLSGVVVVSVLTKSYFCPGKCIFCPTEKGFPKSYLSGEPAAERAKRLKFDPYLQVKKRLESLEKQGHPTDKIEIRIIGGSFSVYPKDYKIWFVANCFSAANGNSKISNKKISWKILEREQKINEKSKQRIVGISIETRPDLITKEEILNLRKLGVTMVELGVQTIFDEVLEKCQRGHGKKEIILATKLLKDSGFKVLYQMMPNLPGSNYKKDLECFRNIFKSPDFKPDWLKIYPCVVCKNSELYKIWKKGDYKSYSDRTLTNLLIKIKEKLPYWVRLARLFRDIPSPKIKGGCKISNLREVVLDKMKKEKKACRCIRCREVRGTYDPKEKIFLFREDYEASDGKEIFLSFENKKRTKLFSFLRLRIPFRENFYPVLRNSAIIRELQTYGQLVPISEKRIALPASATPKALQAGPQHKGLGKKLIKLAEVITKKEFRLRRIAAISGVGVRDYYRKLGYKLEETYIVKQL
jgi:elongator complex protein 3